jgi:hypothetical protein
MILFGIHKNPLSVDVAPNRTSLVQTHEGDLRIGHRRKT